MSVHTDHPDIKSHGLADGCPRCAEHAARPFDGLDNTNLGALVTRVLYLGSRARSGAEGEALRQVEEAIAIAERLVRAGWAPK